MTLADKKELLLRGLKDRYPETPEEDFDLEALNLFSFLPSELLSQLSVDEMREIYDLPAPVTGQLAPEGQPAPEAPVAEEAKLNEAFTNLTGRQLQGIQRIVRKFSREELTEAQASQLLQSGFGMTDEQAKVWLITQEEEDNGTV